MGKTASSASSVERLEFAVGDEQSGERLDLFLAERLPEFSRTRIQRWIKDGRVLVDEVAARPATKLQGGELVEVEPQPPALLRAEPEDIPLAILYEDEHLAAVNKAAGMIVHVGAGEGAQSGTLVNALLGRYQRLSSLGGELRPGIVHRLDRWTSGVMVVAKNDRAHRGLAQAFEERRLRKTYWAVVHGEVGDPRDGLPRRGRLIVADGVRWIRVEAPIGRDLRNRQRMAVAASGRPAVTDFRALRAKRGASFVEVRIHTGRTHQIRVHLSWVGRPVAGDRLYGGPAPPQGAAQDRFYLHARRLELAHPVTGRPLVLEAPAPAEFSALLEALGLADE